jgi:hypothetical protein
MSFFVQPTSAPKLKTKNIRTISIAVAGVFTVLAVTQLFTFEKFPDLLGEIWFMGSMAAVRFAAALFVTLEVFALPFLLFMPLSPALRVVSMVSGWLVVLGWFIASLYGNISGGGFGSALFGATLPLIEGWWSVLFCIALGILVAWVSWGMWPITRSRR